MTIPETRDRLLKALTARKLLQPIGHGLSAGATAEIQRDINSEIDTILAGLALRSPKRNKETP